MSSGEKKTFKTTVASKGASQDVLSEQILIEPDTTDHVLTVTADSSCTSGVNVELEMSPDGENWCPAVTRTVTATSTPASSTVGNEEYVKLTPDAGEFKNKHARGGLNFDVSGNVVTPDGTGARDLLHQFMGVDKSFNYSMWEKTNVDPSATYKPVLFRHGGKDTYINTEAMEFAKTGNKTQNLALDGAIISGKRIKTSGGANHSSSTSTRYRDWTYSGPSGKINPFTNITGIPYWGQDQFAIHFTMKLPSISGFIELFTIRDSSSSARMQVSINGDQLRVNNNDGSGNWFNNSVDLGNEFDTINRPSNYTSTEYFDITLVSRGDLSSQPTFRFEYDMYINGVPMIKTSASMSQSLSGTVNATTLQNANIDEITIGGSYESQSTNGSFQRGTAAFEISELILIDAVIDEDKVKELCDTKDVTDVSFYSDVVSVYRMGDNPGDNTPAGTIYELIDSDREFTRGGHVTTGIDLVPTSDPVGYAALNSLETETAPSSKFSISGWFNSTATPTSSTSIMSNQGASSGFDLKLTSPTTLSLGLKSFLPYTFTKSYAGQMSSSSNLETPWEAGAFVGSKNLGWLAEFDNGGIISNSGASGSALFSGNSTDTYNYSMSFWARVSGGSTGGNDWNTVMTQSMVDFNGYIQAFSIGIRRQSSTLYDINVFWIKNNQRHQVRWYNVGTSGGGYEINSGTWEHWTLAFDGNENGMQNLKLYKNGADQGAADFDSSTLSSGYPSGQVVQVSFLGKLLAYNSTNSDYKNNGTPNGIIEVKDFGVWDKTLSGTEATEAYNSGVPFDLTTHSASADLTRYFRFREGSGDTLTQVVDQQNSGFVCDQTNLDPLVAELGYRYRWLDIESTDPAYVKTPQTTTITYTPSSAVNAGDWHNIIMQKSTTSSTVIPGTDFNIFLDGEKLTPSSTSSISVSTDTFNGEFGFTIAGDGQENDLQASPATTDASAFKAKLNNFSVHTEDVLPSMIYRAGKTSDLSSLGTLNSANLKHWWELNDSTTSITALSDTMGNGALQYEDGDGDNITAQAISLTSGDSILSTGNIDGNAFTVSLVKNFNFTTKEWTDIHTNDTALCLSFNGFQESAEYFALFKCSQTLAGSPIDICDGDWHNIIISYRGQEDLAGDNVAEGDIVKFGPGPANTLDFHWAVSFDGQPLTSINSGRGSDFIGGNNTISTDTYDAQLVNVGFAIYNRHLKFVGANSDDYQVHSQFSAGIHEVSGTDNENAFQGSVDETSFHSECWFIDQAGTSITSNAFNAEKPAAIYGNTTALNNRGAGTSYPVGVPYPLNDPSGIGSSAGGNQYINPDRYDASTNPNGGLEGWWRWGDTPGDCSITINDVKDHDDSVNSRDINAFGITTADRVDMSLQGAAESIYNATTSSGGGTNIVITFPQVIVENVQTSVCNLKDMLSPILQYLRVKWTGTGSCDLGTGKGEASINYRKRRKR